MDRGKFSDTDPADYGESRDDGKALNTRRDFSRRHKTPSGRSGKGVVKRHRRRGRRY